MKVIDSKKYIRFIIKKNNIDRIISSIYLILNIDLTINVGLKVVIIENVKFINFKNAWIGLYAISYNIVI